MANESKEITELDFGQVLDHTCMAYELLRGTINNTVTLSFTEFAGVDADRRSSFAQRSFAKDFLSSANILYRLCSRTENRRALSRFLEEADLDAIVAATKELNEIRNVHVHSLEVDSWSKPTRKVEKFSLPGGVSMSFYVSELWLRDINKVPYFGEVNLEEVYKAIEPIRQKAGYMAVHIKRNRSTRNVP